MNEIENIVFIGLKQGWAKDNIIGQIKYQLANKDEAEILFICGEDSIAEITAEAEKLYKEYREKYYNEMTKAVYTKNTLLDIMGSYLRQISRDDGKHPTVVLNDIKNSIQYVLKVNEYDGKYKDEIK
jgi:predicted ATP-dependent serine protease